MQLGAMFVVELPSCDSGQSTIVLMLQDSGINVVVVKIKSAFFICLRSHDLSFCFL